MTLEIYGHAGCTTVKKAREWAEGAGLSPHYEHFVKVPDLEKKLRSWVSNAGIDNVFNEKARTLKSLPEAEQTKILANDESRISAMLADPRLIKRPVGTNGKTVLTGFKPDDWEAAFA